MWKPDENRIVEMAVSERTCDIANAVMEILEVSFQTENFSIPELFIEFYCFSSWLRTKKVSHQRHGLNYFPSLLRSATPIILLHILPYAMVSKELILKRYVLETI